MLTALCLSLGACFAQDATTFHLYSEHATRVEVCLYNKAVGSQPQECRPLEVSNHVWSLTIPASANSRTVTPRFYGYRVWGPNWPYDSAWRPGSLAGFRAQVDEEGNRFNPNKLVLDPYALEVSHGLEQVPDLSVFDPRRPEVDSGPWAPKAVLTPIAPRVSQVEKPHRPFKDEVIYEVHIKGLTAGDVSVPEAWRGTYKGAALKAEYLKDLGVTAVEFMPLAQKATPKDQPNYWGYMPLGYFAPERSYAFDQSPGGPTREFRAMIDAFHRAGLKVYVDVVYNHTAEGGIPIYSWRGIDNALYYDLSVANKAFYNDNTGCGHNLAAYRAPVREMIMDSLHHWHDQLGVDGFRFDLAAVLGNNPQNGHFIFDRDDSAGVLQRAVRELDGADLIAEPWAIGNGTYQQGNFPPGWSEWNGAAFRDPWRTFLNLRGVEGIQLGTLAEAQSGSAWLFQWNGRKPWNAVNFISAHDGFTLRDLFSYNGKNNSQSFPYGPSDGGNDTNLSWDQGGNPILQRQAVRTALVGMLTAAGTPMLSGGDEIGRTLRGNNNPYNLDTPANYLGWGNADPLLHDFVRYLLHFRREHPGMRPAEYFTGHDLNNNGLNDITWYTVGAREMTAVDFQQTGGFLAYRLDLSETESSAVRSVYFATNADFTMAQITLPPPAPGYAWFRTVDTSPWFEAAGNFHPPGFEVMLDARYDLYPRAALIMIERAL